MKEYLSSLKKRKRLMDIRETSFSPLLFTSFLFTAICKASSDSCFAFLYFFFRVTTAVLGTWLENVSSSHLMSSCPLAEQKCLEFWRGDDSCQDRPPLLRKRRCAGPWIGLGGKGFFLDISFHLKDSEVSPACFLMS